MSEENYNEGRPRFDSQTGEPIYYTNSENQNAAQEHIVQNSTAAQKEAAAQNSDVTQNGATAQNSDVTQSGTAAEQNSQYGFTAKDLTDNVYRTNQTGPTSQTSQTNQTYDYYNTASTAEAPKTAEQIKQEQKAAKNAAKAAKKAARQAGKASSRGKITAGGVCKIAAAAVLFGVIAGGTMFGVNYAGNRVFPASTKNIEIPTVTTTGTTTSTVQSESDVLTTTTMDVTAVAKAAMPAIVALNGKVTTTASNYYYPFGGGTQEASTSGTGIIVGKNDTELLIVTNAHVVDGVNNLSCQFTDSEQVAATVKGSKSDKDIAVVAVKLTDMKDSTLSSIAIAELGDSDSAQIGEQVVAIGNALGKGQSVTVGWISAMNRSITVENTVYSNLIMTDAAINPGNSGGALLNSRGQVIGINSAKYSSEEVEGMGYAIPISSVRDILDNLMNRQTRSKVSENQKAYLGITGVTVTSAISQSYGYPQGALIRQVLEGTPAANAGLAANDVIVGFDGQSVVTFNELTSLMQYYAAGETVVVDYYHMDGGEYKMKSVSVTLAHSTANQ